VEERNQQVVMMGEVYTKAGKVITWLGSGYEATIQALERFDRNRNSLEFLAQHLDELSANDYWSRVWIIQEFVLGRELEIWSGAIRVIGHRLVLIRSSKLSCHGSPESWEEYRIEGAHSYNYLHSTTSILPAAFYCRHAYQGPVGTGRNDFYLSLEALPKAFGPAECSDARDHIYGLLPLVDPRELEAHPIYPDYSRSTSALFAEIWNRNVRRYSFLSIEWYTFWT
jgi:hypothetical protein